MNHSKEGIRDAGRLRSGAAAVCLLAFLVLFCLSSVTAAATVKETPVSVTMPVPKLVFSLSSASILLVPLALCSALISVFCLAGGKQRNVGALFALAAFLFFLGFLIFFMAEKDNSTLYTPVSQALKDAGVKFKKRDVKEILSVFDAPAWLALAAAGLAFCLAFPNVKTESDRRRLGEELKPYAYIGPHLFFFILFFITPAVYGIYAAFTKWDLFNEPVFTGLDNFRTLLTDSGNTYYKQLRNGLWNTVKFVIYSVPFCILIPLSLAVALHTRCRGNKFFQAMYYLPSLMSITTTTLTWRYFFNIDYGIMNKFLGSTANWFRPPHSWIMLVVVTVWWCAGGTMVIYQSALASIPQDHYEAASVDGANAWQKFLHITLPGMRYPLMYTLVMSVVAQFNIYGQPDILTGFAYQEANAVLLMYVYENSVKKQVAGISAAMALILGLCIMVVSFIQIRVLRANTPDE